MREFELRVLDMLRSPRALFVGLTVVAIFGLALWASPLVAALVVAPLALVAAFLASNASAERSRESARDTISAGLDRHARNGRRLSILDPQTALLQRWYFELRVADEARRCRRYGLGMSVLCIKVEDDKAHANDPDWTTEVQVDLVQVLARQLRAVDLASRIGEHEFALCLPHTGEEGISSLAWRISQNVSAYELTMRRALAPDQGFDFQALSEAAEVFIPQKPVSKATVDTPSTHPELVQLVKSSPYGEVPIAAGQTTRSAKTKLRRASKSAGIEVRIWEAAGVLHFERVEGQVQSGVA